MMFGPRVHEFECKQWTREIVTWVYTATLQISHLERDLEAQWPVVAEGIQTILRRAGYPEPYERLKDLTRGKDRITQQDIVAFIEQLDVAEEVKVQLRRLTPHTYTGIDLLARVTP